jgi:ribose/xylose/arabinose/galactoside ABC-type transport system permease subunit
MTPGTLIPDDRAAAPRSRFLEIVNVLGVYVVVLALFAAGCLVSRDFLTPKNLMNTLQAVMLLGIVSVGLAFITYSQHYVDLSIPGIMALSGTVAVWALPYGIAASLGAGLAVGLLAGLVNGLVVGYLRLNPILWTLAMMSVLSGIIRKVYAGQQIYPDPATPAGAAFLNLYHMGINIHVPLGEHPVAVFVPLPLALLAVLAAAACVVMGKTRFGVQLKLVGSSYEVARMTGVAVGRTIAAAFVISAATCAIAGILLASFNKVGASYLGEWYDFKAITAVVIGGMALAGGRGNIVGVLGGVMVIALMDNVMGLVLVKQLTLGGHEILRDFTFSEFHKGILRGAIFILVVGASSYSRRKSGLDDA